MSKCFNMYNHIPVYMPYRLVTQVITRGVTVLGGITFRVLSPNVLQALNHCLRSTGLEPVSNAVATLYRVNIKGEVFTSRAYQRATKRNSYTVSCIRNNSKEYAFVEYYVCVHGKIFAILTMLNISPISVKEHFNIRVSIPVSPVIEEVSSIEVCPLELIKSKCMFIDFGPYVVDFPSQMTFD